ncbi:hypothetical protein DLD82_17535 [Methanospirillum stamsii]|uniref:Uncharacterized protein n=1 Tax=Methanospirillum stamsii TaxID=1277351 RepID=A0A2V2MW09_9EURY|nr:hypothetical protein DLD82_17535 [Methanospirillum stamsii]
MLLSILQFSWNHSPDFAFRTYRAPEYLGMIGICSCIIFWPIGTPSFIPIFFLSGNTERED